MTKPSKSAALHIDLCKATSPADALQYLLQFARKPVEAESVEGVVRILLEHYYKVRRSWDLMAVGMRVVLYLQNGLKWKINKVFIQQSFPECLLYARCCGYRDEKGPKDPKRSSP